MANLNRLTRRVAKRIPQIRGLVEARDVLADERHRLAEERDLLLDERDRLVAENAALLGRLDAWNEREESAARELDDLRRRLWVPPGHVHSPIPDLADVRSRWNAIWDAPPGSLAPLDLRVEEQLALLDELAAYYASQPFPETRTPGYRYHLDNPWFAYADGLFLHTLIRHLKPRRIVEIGSGWPSCAILDTNERFFGNAIEATFVDPHPDVLYALITEQDRASIRLVEERVEALDPVFFGDLESGDILFVDSSHVSKAGSDVNHVVLHVLPALADGVVVHFHDVFHPFEYPLDWLEEGRTWTETYLLHAFLLYNDHFRIMLWADYLARFHGDRVHTAMPLTAKNSGGSLWLRKAGRPGAGVGDRA